MDPIIWMSDPRICLRARRWTEAAAHLQVCSYETLSTVLSNGSMQLMHGDLHSPFVPSLSPVPLSLSSIPFRLQLLSLITIVREGT